MLISKKQIKSMADIEQDVIKAQDDLEETNKIIKEVLNYLEGTDEKIENI